MAVGDAVRELGGGGRDGDHEDEVEQQFELARRAVRLVDRARAHPDADPDPGAHRRQGLAPSHSVGRSRARTAQRRCS
jgi:hypothetical protein